jgi:hypothetical protein
MKSYRLTAIHQYDDAPLVRWWALGKRNAKNKAKILLNNKIGEHKPFEVIVFDEYTNKVVCQLRLTTDGELVEHFAKW